MGNVLSALRSLGARSDIRHELQLLHLLLNNQRLEVYQLASSLSLLTCLSRQHSDESFTLHDKLKEEVAKLQNTSEFDAERSAKQILQVFEASQENLASISALQEELKNVQQDLAVTKRKQTQLDEDALQRVQVLHAELNAYRTSPPKHAAANEGTVAMVPIDAGSEDEAITEHNAKDIARTDNSVSHRHRYVIISSDPIDAMPVTKHRTQRAAYQAPAALQNIMEHSDQRASYESPIDLPSGSRLSRESSLCPVPTTEPYSEPATSQRALSLPPASTPPADAAFAFHQRPRLWQDDGRVISTTAAKRRCDTVPDVSHKRVFDRLRTYEPPTSSAWEPSQ